MVSALPMGVMPQFNADCQPTMGLLLVPSGSQLAPAGNAGHSLEEVEMVPEHQGVSAVIAQQLAGVGWGPVCALSCGWLGSGTVC